MRLFYKFKKSIPPGNGGSAGDTESAAPKRTGFFSLFKKVLPLLVLFIWVESSAQFQDFSHWFANKDLLEWDPNVGCSRPVFRDDDKIEEDRCINVCQGSTVEYFIRDYFASTFSYYEDLTVDWVVTGGTVLDIYDETDPKYGIKIKWDDTWTPGIAWSIRLILNYGNGLFNKEYYFCIRRIEPPTAYFEIEGGVVEGEYTLFCKDSTVFFNNLSTGGWYGIKSTLWDFGDGNYSSQFHPQHTYTQPGEYKVTLTVTNRCNCESTYSMTVFITEDPAPIISCPGVTVQNDSRITYTTEDPCGGEWSVSGGTITDGGSGDFVEVIWDSIDLAEGFGYIYYNSECGCFTAVKVPVVTSSAVITGDAFICEGNQHKFSLPQWPTTEFGWSYSGDVQALIHTDQPNEVIVEGLQPGTYLLECNYHNTLWGYSGTAQISVTVGPKEEITGNDTEFCNNSGTYTYTTVSGASVNWELWRNGVIIPVASSTGINFSYNFPDGGIYTLFATTPNGCMSDPFEINVTEVPTPTGEIEGSKVVCENLTYTYTYENTAPDTLIIWEASGGATILGNNTGGTVNVVFNGTGPYTLTVKRRSQNQPICWAADELTQTITKVNPNLFEIINDDAAGIFCPSSDTSFTAEIGELTYDHIEWELQPSNFGNIIAGLNDKNVTISWNEISNNNNTGTLLMTVMYCGGTEAVSLPVALHEMPTISLANIGTVCPEDDTITVAVAVSGATTGDILFEFGNGNSETLPIDPGGLYTLVNQFTNASATNIFQSLTVTLENPNGCLYAPSDTKIAEVYPETKIGITPGYDGVICTDDPYSHTLYSAVSTGITSSVEFQWYKNDTPISGATGSSYTISDTSQPNPAGEYYVEVKDKNGCIVYSNKINVYVECDGGNSSPACDNLPFTPDPIVTGQWNCDTITANVSNTAPNPPIGYTWIAAGLNIVSGQGTANVVFTTDIPGVYPIFVTLDYGEDCFITKSTTVVKSYQPKLNIGVECDNNNGYTVTLYNNSLISSIGNNEITFSYYEGNIADPDNPGVAPIATGQQSSPMPLSAGTHTYTLILSASNMPNCMVTESITLHPLTPPTFTLAEEFCAEAVIELTVDNYNPEITYSWWFDDTYIYASGETTKVNIAIAGFNYEITLKAELPYGCTVVSDDFEIDIFKADGFVGSLSPNPINVCGEAVIPAIIFEPAPFTDTPSGYIWMRGNEPIDGATNVSFTPTESGQYWVVLIDDNGCKNHHTAANPVSVSISSGPHVSITGNNHLCYGDTTVLRGILTDTGLKRQWLLDGNPMSGSHGVLSTTTPLEVEIENILPNLTAETYEYTLYVEDALGCSSETTFVLTAYPQLTVPALDYNVVLCSPYTVQIDVTNIQTGEYYWSNGTTGTSTEVTSGGIYQVIYVAPTGCEISATITIPEDPEKSIWIFPTGCFDMCIWDMDPLPYIIGPQGEYESHRWYVNGEAVQSGSGQIFPLDVEWAGAYQLVIWEGSCTYETGFAYITPDIEACEIEPCQLDYSIGEIEVGENIYYIHGTIYNGYGSPITVTFTSLNGFGTYSTGFVTIPVSGSYNFSPLEFTPNPGFMGGDDYLVISVVGGNCVTLAPIHFPMTYPHKLLPTGTELVDNSKATLRVTPNPAGAMAAVSYHLGTEYQKAESLRIYTMLGTPVTEIDLKANNGDLPIDLSRLPVGTYIITLQADGKTILHQKLVKK